ncbi:MAG: histidine kinase N-terminal 7TM domain-containing protein [Candidatus Paceibacterota bacterium]|jgi:hypothetical protein
MNDFWLYYSFASNILNAVTSAVCAFFIFFNNPKAKVNRLAALTAISTSIWATSWAIQTFIEQKELALFWARMLNFAVIAIPILYLHWVLALLGIEKQLKNKIVLSLGWLFTAFFAVFAFTPFFVLTVKLKPYFLYYSEPGTLHPFYMVLYGALLSYLIYSLFQSYKTADNSRKVQIKYILLTAVLGFAGASTNYLTFYNIPIPPFGSPLTGIAFISLTYSIIRYRIFEVKTILTEILLSVMVVSIGTLPFLMPTDFLRLFTVSIFLLFCCVACILLRYVHREIKTKELLEQKVAERTKELGERNEELEKWYKLTIGREVRMAELKEKIKEIEGKGKLVK